MADLELRAEIQRMLGYTKYFIKERPQLDKEEGQSIKLLVK
jgi:hypothetical protein